MEISFIEIIRETRNAINSRLDMLEMLVNKHSCNNNYQYYSNSNSNSCDYHRIDYLNNKINNVSDKLYDLECIINNMNKVKLNEEELSKNVSKQSIPEHTIPENSIPEQSIPEQSIPEQSIPELIVEDDAISKIKKDMNGEEYCDECGGECDGVHGASGEKALVQMKERGLEVKDNKVVPITKAEEEEEQQQQEEVVEEEVAEEEEEVAEEEEEVAEEETQLTEFEYKGMTLYHDADMIVYQLDEEGALSDPIGRYDAEKQKIKKL